MRPLSHTFCFESFASACQFVDRIAEVAEVWDHHPQIEWRHMVWVNIEIFTHSQKKVTDLDKEFMNVCQQLAVEQKVRTVLTL